MIPLSLLHLLGTLKIRKQQFIKNNRSENLKVSPCAQEECLALLRQPLAGAASKRALDRLTEVLVVEVPHANRPPLVCLDQTQAFACKNEKDEIKGRGKGLSVQKS